MKRLCACKHAWKKYTQIYGSLGKIVIGGGYILNNLKVFFNSYIIHKEKAVWNFKQENLWKLFVKHLFPTIINLVINCVLWHRLSVFLKIICVLELLFKSSPVHFSHANLVSSTSLFGSLGKMTFSYVTMKS